MDRANDDAGNLRASYRLRESLDSFIRRPDGHGNNGETTTRCTINAVCTTLGCMSIRGTFGSTGDISGGDGGDSGGGGDNKAGVIGVLSDLVTVPDPRIARALSHARRAALTTVSVHSGNAVSDFRRHRVHTGPVNFLPTSTLRLQHPQLLPPPPTRNYAESASPGGWGVRDDGGYGEDEVAGLLPPAPETTAPAGFLGYAVRLLRLRPEHEPLRWTVLFAVFKDLVVFETTEQVGTQSAKMWALNGLLRFLATEKIVYAVLADDAFPRDMPWLRALPTRTFKRLSVGQATCSTHTISLVRTRT